MRIVLFCLPLLLAACGDSRLSQPVVLPASPAPVAAMPPVAAPPTADIAAKSACERAFEQLHRKPAALTTAGVVETVLPATSIRCG